MMVVQDANPAVVPGQRRSRGSRAGDTPSSRACRPLTRLRSGGGACSATRRRSSRRSNRSSSSRRRSNGEYERAELEVGEVFRERGQGDSSLSWCHAEPSRRTRSLLRGKGPNDGTEVTLRQTGAEVLSTGPPPRTRIHDLGRRPDRHVRPGLQRHGADVRFSVAVVRLVQGPSCGLQPAEEVRDLPFQR